MRRLLSPLLLALPLFILFSAYYYQNKHTASAAIASDVVISEIQIAGADSDEDFIELYNPTDLEINLGDMRLVKRTSTGVTDTDIVVFGAGDSISAYGYYLWCNTILDASLNCDKSSSDTLSNNNSVGLRKEPANTGSLVDSVTFGTPANPLGEGTFLAAPLVSSSVERKANSLSSITSMATGGADELAGNGEDTDNNSTDFVTRTTPQPQNSESSIEPNITPTPTVETTPTPSEVPTPTPTMTIEPIASPTPSPSPIPEVSPTPTETPMPTPTLSVPPTPTPRIIARWPNFACFLTTNTIRIMGFQFKIPSVRCMRI